MWKEAAMSFTDSLTVSLLGISVVFLMLLVLLLAILVISWIVRRMAGQPESKAMQGDAGLPGTPGPDQEAGTAEMMAVLMAVLSQETGIAPQNLKIRSIKEAGELCEAGKETE